VLHTTFQLLSIQSEEHMRKNTLVLIGCLVFHACFSGLNAGSKLLLTPVSVGQTIISVDPPLHQRLGLSYPVTYAFQLPAGSGGLVVYSRRASTAAWTRLVEKTANDLFNGTEAVRFDYAANAAYVSVAFDSNSDDIYLRFTNGAGQPIDIQFRNICRYYDNRQSVVTLTADDWKEYTNLAFVHAVHTLRSYNLPVTVAIITGGCTANTWRTIQSELDSGLVEPASHSRSHLNVPYPDPTSEIIGSRQDILANLRLPFIFRKGSQGYVYTWIPPYGETTTSNEAMVSKAGYLIDRGVSASTGNFSSWSAADQRYIMDGVTAEMGPLWGGLTDANALNNRFNQSMTAGTIYHLMMHPQLLADSNIWARPDIPRHLSYISNRRNIWYANFGALYLYHFLGDPATGTIDVGTGSPAITVQPANASVGQGQTATFSVSASGVTPLSYQWQKNGVDIKGATNPSYTTPAVSMSDSGSTFDCVVSNPVGTATSLQATLTVLRLSNILANPSFENGTSSPWVFYSNGIASFSIAAFGSDGTRSARIAVTAEGTNVQLYQANLTVQSNTSYTLSFDAYSNTGHDLEVSLEKHVSPYTNYGLLSRYFNLSTNWQRFSVTFTTSGFSGTAADGRLLFWFAPYEAAGDEYHIDNVVLSPVNSVQVFGAPVITSQPVSQSVTVGQTATFSVTASGTAPLAYQWQKNGSSLAGGTTATYTTPPTIAADSGTSFRCVVTNSAGTATTQAALLLVTSVPVAGGNVVTNGAFESGTTGWTFYSNGAATLSTSAPGASGTGTAAQVAVSTEGTNVQLYQSGIALQPSTSYRLSFDAYSNTGHDVEVSLGQHISPYTNYGLSGWKFDLTNSWQTFSVTFTTTGFSTPVTDGRLFFWLAPFDAAGDRFYFDNVQLARISGTNSTAPVITTQPTSQTVAVGQSATFSVAATGTAPLSYQWQKNSTDISGATNTSYTIASATTADSGALFRCRVSNAAGSVMSAQALLAVTASHQTSANVLTNGTFEGGTTGWNFYTNGAAVYATTSPGSSGSGLAMQVSITTEGTNVQLFQYGITLQPYTRYTLTFDAYCSSGHDLEVSLAKHVSPYTSYGLSGQMFNLTSGWQSFSVTFTTSGFSTVVADGRLMFWLAPYDAAGDRFYFDKIVLAPSTSAQVVGSQESLQQPANVPPQEFALEGNFPNPFNMSTAIRYVLPEPAMVSIGVFNVLGQEVARIIDGYEQAGTYQVNWSGRGTSGEELSSGIYLCRMAAATNLGQPFIATRRMLLLK
jgi:hypothetical protein